jgi:hypothetical protein
MAWHHRQRYGLQRARAAMLAGDPGVALQGAQAVQADAQGRGSRRYRLLASACIALARVALGETLDQDTVDADLAGLDSCAALESWSVTAELAAASGQDRWWRDAERRAGALIGNAGDDGESLRRWVASRFTALGRR